MRGFQTLALSFAALATAPLAAAPVAGACANGVCSVTLTADQLARNAFALIDERRFAEAAPMIAALENVPGLAVERHFLAGYVAVESGKLQEAIAHFRAALAIDPKQTRIRLELARAMMLSGKNGAADYNFRLAQQDDSLPPEIAATIRASRGILRDSRPWHFSSQFGFAPDTNITGGTSAQTVDVVLGDQMVPLTLDDAARSKSGIGQTGSLSAGYRFKLGGRAAFLIDADGQGTNYSGTANDDITAQIAVGPELRLSDATSVSFQGIGLQRWYGGHRAATQFGGRIALQQGLSASSRMGVTLDARHTASGFADAYSGWNLAAYASYERVVARSMIANANLFVRADRLNAAAYSSTEFGLGLGIGGELAHGVNAGVSATASRAIYAAPMALLSPTPRTDWRLSARVYAGLRSLRFLGFSPSVSYTFTRGASSLPLYDTRRSRFDFALARYF